MTSDKNLLSCQTKKYEIGVQYSLFSTDDGEWYSGGGEFMIEDFAKWSGNWLRLALGHLLKDNPNKTFSLVITSEALNDSSHTTKKTEE